MDRYPIIEESEVKIKNLGEQFGNRGTINLLDADEGRFLVTGPVWMLLDRSCLRVDHATGSSMIRSGANVLGGVAEAGPFVVAFTDRDLAERFLEHHPAGDLIPVCFEDHDDLAAFLERMNASGYTHVAFDPNRKGTAASLAPIQRVLEAIARGPE